MFRWRGTPLVALLAVSLAALTACGPDESDSDAGPAAAPPASGGSASPADLMTEAKTMVASAFKGTYKQPDPAIRIAKKGIRVAIISRGQQSPSSKIPTDAAEEAARALGWNVLRFDLELDPKKAPQAVREAHAAGVHAIITNIDCAYAQQDFATAKGDGVLIVPLFAFDCTDPLITGSPGPSQFTTFVNYSGTGQRIEEGRRNAAAGVLAANAVILATQAKAKVLAFSETSSTILHYMHLGFVQQIKRCTTCELLEEIKYTANDVASGALRGMVDEALARHPGVTAIRGPNSTAIQSAISPALQERQMQSRVVVIGGEGLQSDLDLIRAKQGLNITLSFDTPWHAWAVVDTLNSRLNGEDPKYPGVGVMLIDREHNLPPSGPVQHNISFRDVYRKAWGVG
jgi:ribose transport system substrate-binding protein